MEDWADRLAMKLIDNIRDRKGIGDQWYEIDKETQQEIHEEFAEMIRGDTFEYIVSIGTEKQESAQ